MVCSKRFSVSVHVCACGTVWVFECARVSVFVRFQSVCVCIVFELVCVYCVGFVTQYIYQTSPIFHQTSPIFHQKSPALYKRALYSINRALYSVTSVCVLCRICDTDREGARAHLRCALSLSYTQTHS